MVMCLMFSSSVLQLISVVIFCSIIDFVGLTAAYSVHTQRAFQRIRMTIICIQLIDINESYATYRIISSINDNIDIKLILQFLT
jgi:hypothetical protein